MTIGQKINQFRLERHITQAELAKTLNVSNKVISNWETSKTLPDVEIMKSLALALDVSILDLYDCIEDDKISNKEKYDYKMVWSFIRVTIISCLICFLSALIIPFMISIFCNLTPVDEILTIVFKMLLVLSIVISFSLETTSFVHILTFSRTKHDKYPYNKAIAIGIPIYLVILIFSIIMLFVPYIK